MIAFILGITPKVPWYEIIFQGPLGYCGKKKNDCKEVNIMESERTGLNPSWEVDTNALEWNNKRPQMEWRSCTIHNKNSKNISFTFNSIKPSDDRQVARADEWLKKEQGSTLRNTVCCMMWCLPQLTREGSDLSLSPSAYTESDIARNVHCWIWLQFKRWTSVAILFMHRKSMLNTNLIIKLQMQIQHNEQLVLA